MPEMKHSFQRGRMNKDHDERIVPNGEYREALNVEVSTSEGSDIGALQTIKGNTILSQVDSSGNKGLICIGSIEDNRTNKIYWFATGTEADSDGKFYDIVAEYDYVTNSILPVCVDVHYGTNRVLNFNEDFHITGLNVMDGILYWTDNNSEPKKINIERCKAGSNTFTDHTKFMVKNTDPGIPPGSWKDSGPLNSLGVATEVLIREDHLTIIRKGPKTAPVLEMRDTTIGDTDNDNFIGGGELNTALASSGSLDFLDPITGDLVQSINVTTINTTDIPNGYYVTLYSLSDTVKKIRAQVTNVTQGASSTDYELTIFSGNKEINGQEDIWIEIEQSDPLFEFKFPRFAVRYKYEDGEYSQFSPFTQVAFLPGQFDYMPKEGYNLAMTNNLRKLAIKNFVYSQSIPEDVIAIDILYKESNSPNIYSVKQVKKVLRDPNKWDAWNADSATSTVSDEFTKGFLPITSEMIHAVLPANQLLRPWDNVPRKALAQEIIGNRLIYGNYLQNYNLSNEYTGEQNIKIDINANYVSTDVSSDWQHPEEIHGGLLPTLTGSTITRKYRPAKSIKSLRTYQLGVVYLDKYGRETPVLSEDTRGGTSNPSQSSIYIPKEVADKQTRIVAYLNNSAPDWATHYKYFIKETSNEYYNLAMDRWYDAEDDNIWLSFPSSERNKVDEETYLILKKEHDNNNFVSEPARYKIIAIENEAPRFIKLQNVSLGALTDGIIPPDAATPTGAPVSYAIGYHDMSTFPYVEGTEVWVNPKSFGQAGWIESLVNQDISQVYIRIRTNTAISNYYRLKTVALDQDSGYYVMKVAKPFDEDMSITAASNSYFDADHTIELQVVKRVPEDKAEFEGRFFVKILKDFTLVEKLGTSGTKIELFRTKFTRKVTYINPMSSWAKKDSGDPTETWEGYGKNRKKISIDKRNSSLDIQCTSVASGDGANYWQYASKYVDGDNDSVASGWFIDKCEGFVPIDCTREQFNTDHGLRFEAEDDNVYWYGECGEIGVGIDGAVGRWDYENHPTPMLQKCLGLNTYNNTFNQYNTYLDMGSGVRPPVRADGDNTVEKATIAGGGIGPNKGITGNLIYLSYSGLNEQDLSNNGGKGTTDWANIDFYFDNASIHGADISFINKLTQPGTLFMWEEDPGQIMYKVESITYDFPNEDFSTVDWQKGVPMYNYVMFADYWTNHHHFRYEGEWSNTFGMFEGTCLANKDTLVSRSKIGTVVAGASPGNFKTGFVWQTFTCGWLEDIPILDGIFCNGIGLCGGTFVFMTPRWMCPEKRDRNVDSSMCGLHTNGWNSHGGRGFDSHRVWPVGAYDWDTSYNKRRRFIIKAVPQQKINGQYEPAVDNTGNPLPIGGVGPHYYKPTNSPDYPAHFDKDNNPILSDPNTGVAFTTPAPGIRTDGMYSGYSMDQWYWDSGDPNNAGPNGDMFRTSIPFRKRWDAATPANQSIAPGSVSWSIKEYFVQDAEDNSFTSTNPAIWETEPKEDVGLDIYHEIGHIYPLEINDDTIEQLVGPIQSDVSKNSYVTCSQLFGGNFSLSAGGNPDVRVIKASGSSIMLGAVNPGGIGGSIMGLQIGDPEVPNNSFLTFHRADGSSTSAFVISGNTTSSVPGVSNAWITLHSSSVGALPVSLPWFNCYSFGNGVESDRIRDDYNQVKIDNGPKASTTLEETYLEERRCNGFIWSGIYNSNSGVNDLNQFIQAEAITKDVNPGYGCIQKMHARDNDLVAFCEDRVLKVYANKDALFNADGNTNVVATNRVLGAVKPFVGDYGISKNPESFASDSYRSYFTDASRGAVIRLSQDGLTAISDAGMSDWFSDVLPKYAKVANTKLIGSFDNNKQEYNLTLMSGEFGGPCSTDPCENFPTDLGQACCDKNCADIIQNYPNHSCYDFCVEWGHCCPAGNFNSDDDGDFEPTDGNPLGNWFRYGGITDAWSLYVESGGTDPMPLGASLIDANKVTISGGWGGIQGCTNCPYPIGVNHGDQGLIANPQLNNGGMLTLYFQKNTFGGSTVASNPGIAGYPQSYDTSQNWNALSIALTANGPGNVYIYQNFWEIISGQYTLNLAQWNSNPNNAGHSPETCYAVHSINYNAAWETYIVEVEWIYGKSGYQDTQNFVWSLQGPTTSTGNGNGNTNTNTNTGTIIQNIEDEVDYTVVYSESSKGWTSFRSYLQESGVSLNNEYYTFKGGEMYLHNSNEDRNNFYGLQYDSYVSIILNQQPSVVKSFSTIGYEGTKQRITQDLENSSYADNYPRDGWYVSDMKTNLQEVSNLEFVSKEERYFSQIKGVTTIWKEDGTAGNIDPKEFSFQGIGNALSSSCPGCDPTVSWNCQGTPCECVKVNGSQGQYPTELACKNDTSGCCGDPENWCFSNGLCIEGDGGGPYNSLCDCIEENLPCNMGSYWIECVGLPTPNPYLVGCMDDGITIDPFIVQDRPAGWIGPATNYDPIATVPDCSCLYETPETYNCVNDSCIDPGDGSGTYTGPNALVDCQTNCVDPCVNQNMGLDKIVTMPSGIGPADRECDVIASDGTISVSVTNNNSTSPIPFTSWQWELYDSLQQNGPPTIGALLYSDPNWYATGVYSNVYTGLTATLPSATGIYYVKITDNNGCEYGPFVVRVVCDPGTNK